MQKNITKLILIFVSFVFVLQISNFSYANPASILLYFVRSSGNVASKILPNRASIARSYKVFRGTSVGRYSAARNIRRYGLRVINKKYAGRYYPLNKLPVHLQKKYPNSVRIDRNGYPDFSPYSRKTIRSTELTGNYANDFSIANRAAGYSSTPTGYTWHHHQNGRDMLLIPKDIHAAVRHSGGASYLGHSVKNGN